jgi:hypothetical protein
MQPLAQLAVIDLEQVPFMGQQSDVTASLSLMFRPLSCSTICSGVAPSDCSVCSRRHRRPDVILEAIERQLKSPMKPRRTAPVARIWPLLRRSCRLLNHHTHLVVGQVDLRQLTARRRLPPRNVGYPTQGYTPYCAAFVSGRLRSLYGECNNFTGRR